MFKLSRQKGQGLVEYALILVLIAMVVIGILSALGPRVQYVFATITDKLQNPGGGGNGPTASASISVSAAANCGGMGGTCSGVHATASVTVRDSAGSTVSAPATVRFVNQANGTSRSGSGSGSVNSGDLGSGSSGSSVQACVTGVTGYTLTNNPCASDSY